MRGLGETIAPRACTGRGGASVNNDYLGRSSGIGSQARSLSILMAEQHTGFHFCPVSTMKRARQACENCRYLWMLFRATIWISLTQNRRKKSKCSGEKPECSFCVRLKQKCVYARHHRERSLRENHIPFDAGIRSTSAESRDVSEEST
jgi:hypothetical protein